MKIKNIDEFIGLYQITSTGIVIALEKKVKMPNGGHKTILKHKPKLSNTKQGYLKVMLTNKNGKRRGFFVHRLVALSFIGESTLQVNHIDKNKHNNNIKNLEYVTNRENQIHSIDKSKTTSKYVGVTRKRDKWQAQKMMNGKYKYLGLFDTEEEAAQKYIDAGL